MITEREALEYEAGRVSFFMSIVYAFFPSLFARKIRTAYKRYEFFMAQKEMML